jgi:hypothetical protein
MRKLTPNEIMFGLVEGKDYYAYNGTSTLPYTFLGYHLNLYNGFVKAYFNTFGNGLVAGNVSTNSGSYINDWEFLHIDK